MSELPSNPGLARQLAVLEERMKTMQAEYRTDIARLAEDNAKRETRLLLAMAAMIGLATATIGVLIAGLGWLAIL